MQKIILHAALATLGVILVDRLVGLMHAGLSGRITAPLLHAVDLMLLVCIAFPISLAVMRKLDCEHRVLEELKETNRNLQERADRDRMTGFHNREAFFERFRHIRRKMDSGALLLIDADHFKAINDTYGHLTGDRALKIIARAILRSVRECDMVGRIGGEEFCVFLPAVTREEGSVVAERVRAEVERIVFWPRSGTQHKLSVSVGVSACDSRCSLIQLLRRADLCLYEAKNSGRNKVVMDESPKLMGSDEPDSRSGIGTMTQLEVA